MNNGFKSNKSFSSSVRRSVSISFLPTILPFNFLVNVISKKFHEKCLQDYQNSAEIEKLLNNILRSKTLLTLQIWTISWIKNIYKNFPTSVHVLFSQKKSQKRSDLVKLFVDIFTKKTAIFLCTIKEKPLFDKLWRGKIKWNL